MDQKRAHPEIVRYVARVDGQAASAAVSFVKDGVMCIAGTATRSEFRRRGLQSAIVARALDRVPGWRERGAVMIGDREHDAQAASANGIDSIGVGYGYGSDEELGKPHGSDERQGKLTYVSLFGLERARELAAESHASAREALSDVDGQTADLELITDF